MKIELSRLRNRPSFIKGRFGKDKKHKRYDPRYLEDFIDTFDSHPAFD